MRKWWTNAPTKHTPRDRRGTGYIDIGGKPIPTIDICHCFSCLSSRRPNVVRGPVHVPEGSGWAPKEQLERSGYVGVYTDEDGPIEIALEAMGVMGVPFPD